IANAKLLHFRVGKFRLRVAIRRIGCRIIWPCWLIERDDLGLLRFLDEIARIERAELVLSESNAAAIVHTKRRSGQKPRFRGVQLSVGAHSRLSELLLTREDAHFIVVPKVSGIR